MPDFSVLRIMAFSRWLCACLLAGSLSAQIQFPGQIPPGSTRPGGRNPNGSPYPTGTGGRFPGGGGRSNGGNPSPSPRLPGRGGNKKDAPIVITTTGVLRLLAGNQFVLEADDHRVITYRASDKLTVQREAQTVELTSFAPGDHLSVDANADEQGFFTAVGVTFTSSGTPYDRRDAARSWDLPRLDGPLPAAARSAKTSDDDDARPTLRRANPDPVAGQPSAARGANAGTSAEAQVEAVEDRPSTQIRPDDAAPDADDPGRPQLRRGRPPARSSARSESEPPQEQPRQAAPESRTASAPAVDTPTPIAIQEDPTIAKAREASASFAGTLPNFFCLQLTTRYESESPRQGWQALDTIQVDLAYENGRESYKNIKIGNKPTNKGMEDLGGSWSTGEFSSSLENLFEPGTAATFRRSGQETLRGRPTTIFKFDVKRENSNWRVMAPSQLYYPAYRGTIWVDRETSRILRMEKEARNVPFLFPFDKLEEATDYELIRLSTPQPFLLPTVAEVLACQQGSTRCTRNRIEFRNYRKFGAESGITFDEKP